MVIREKQATIFLLAAAIIMVLTAPAFPVELYPWQDGTKNPNVQPVGFTNLSQGVISSLQFRQEVVISNPNHFQEMWSQLFANQWPRPVQPFVDFEHSMVILVSSGIRPTSGYQVRINRVEMNPSGFLVVHYTEFRPGHGCVYNHVQTSPFHLIQVPRHFAQVQFVPHQQVQHCHPYPHYPVK